MLIFTVSFFFTLAIIKVLYPLAVKIDLLDRPCERKHHAGNIPLIGGVAIFSNFIISIFIFDLLTVEVLSLLGAFLVIIILGVTDDYRSLNFKVRFLFQFLATMILLIVSEVELNSVGNIFGSGNVQLGRVAIPFTIFAIIGNMNAFNMIDGIDGLSASLGLVVLVCFYFSTNESNIGNINSVLIIIIASISAFLVINLWAKNKIFMGDAGSMLIGLVISYFAIIFSQESSEVMLVSPIVCLWLLAIPVMDTICIMIRRIKKGQSPFLADRGHLHHIFLRAGYSARQALVIIVGIASLLAGVGLVASSYGAPEWVMVISYLAVFAGYYHLLQHSWVLMRWLKLIHKPADAS